MSSKQFLIGLLAIQPFAASAQGTVQLLDTHTFVHLMVDELEFSDVSNGTTSAWDADLSVGGDLHKFWMKTRGERSSSEDDTTEYQFLYSRAILPFWDIQGGVRRDVDQVDGRNWAVASLKGVAPYFYNVEAELFLAEGGQSSIRVRGNRELLLTQKLILEPELEVLAYGRDEANRMIGSGMSQLEFNVRLRFEVKREIAPYIGLSWHRFYGHTRDFAEVAGREGQDTTLLIGLRAWF